MGFIGTYPIKAGGSSIYQPISGGGEDRSLGMHFFGDYFGSDDETSTEDASYEVFFYVYDSNGDRFPATSGTYSSQVTALIAGTQVVAILDVLSGEALNKNVTLNLTTVFTITTPSDTAIETIPTIASTISGGAYTETLPFTGIAYRIDALVEGDNTVSAYFKDANGDEYTSDNTIAIRFASTAPIIEIDGVDVINPISTTEFEVDVTYLYGGSLLFDAGEEAFDVGEAIYYGGTEVIVPNYALLPAANNVQVIGQIDGFGNAFNTTIQLVTKIPAIINNGLTTIDEETFGTTYAATAILDIDTGSPYQVLGATPTEAPYTFTSGLYEVYNKTASYTYPATTTSNSIAYDITYAAQAGYENDAINSWVYGTPNVGSAGVFVLEDDAGTDRYTSVEDIVADDGDFTQATTARKLEQVQNGFFLDGARFDIGVWSHMFKAYTGNEGWFLAEHCIVINCVGPNNFGSSFEYTVLMNGFTDRPLQTKTFGSGYQIGNNATYATEVLTKFGPQTIIAGRDSGGNYRLISSEGADLTVGSFAGWPASGMYLGYFSNDATKQCDMLVHEITTLPYFPDAGEATEIYSRSVDKWFSAPVVDGNTLTSEGFAEHTSEGFAEETIL